MAAQAVVNTLWAYATMGRAPSAGDAGAALAGRAEGGAPTMTVQHVANTLRAACVLRTQGRGWASAALFWMPFHLGEPV